MKKNIPLLLVLLAVIFLLVACNNQYQQPILKDYQLNVSLKGEGTVFPTSGLFAEGTIIAFEIMPKEGWEFARWEGQDYRDLIQVGERWGVLMNDHKTIQAVFVQESSQEKRQLSVSVQGQGSVTPQGGSYADGELVEFRVIPQTGWTFGAWSGEHGHEVIQNGNNFAIAMTGDKRLIAIFEEVPENNYKLAINIVGQGIVEEEMISQTNADYPAASIVKLWAKPKEGWLFKEWQGDVDGCKDIIYLEMDRDKEITAVFLEIDDSSPRYELDIKIFGGGMVEKSPDLPNYKEGTIVSLTAYPDEGYIFIGWSGNINETEAAIEITMNSNKMIQATFEKIPEVSYAVEIFVEPNDEVGKIIVFPKKERYAEGEVISLLAEQSRGWALAGWEVNGEVRQGYYLYLQVTIEKDTTITAYFQPSL